MQGSGSDVCPIQRTCCLHTQMHMLSALQTVGRVTRHAPWLLIIALVVFGLMCGLGEVVGCAMYTCCAGCTAAACLSSDVLLSRNSELEQALAVCFGPHTRYLDSFHTSGHSAFAPCIAFSRCSLIPTVDDKHRALLLFACPSSASPGFAAPSTGIFGVKSAANDDEDGKRASAKGVMQDAVSRSVGCSG